MDEKRKNPSLGAILGVMTLSHTAASLGNLSLPPLSPFLRDELNLTHAQVGMLMSFIYTGVVSASILSGWLSDLLGERRTLILGLAIQGVFLVSFACTHTFLIAGILLFLAGIGYSSVNPATNKGVMRWFPAQGRATAMGVKQTGIPLGGILAASILPGIALPFGWRFSIVLVGLTTLMVIFAVRVWMPSTPPLRRERSPIFWTQFWEVVSNREILALSVMGIFLAGAQLSIVTHLVLFLKSEFLFSSVLAGIYLAVSQGGGIAGRVCWGLISDFVAGGRRKPVFLAIGIVAIIQLLFLGHLNRDELEPAYLFLIILLAGFTTIGFHGVLYGLIVEAIRKEVVGLGTGFTLTITFLGVILFPPLFGHIVDRLGSYTRAWDMLVLSWIVALLILIFFVKEKRSERSNCS